MPKIKTKSGAKKRFKITGTGKVVAAHRGQASRHDQADQEADPPAARHRRAVQDRRRQHQEILDAQRLIRSLAVLNTRNRTISGDQSWLASNGALPSHAKHKKVLKAAKGFYGRRKNTIRIAKQAVEKANQYAFRDRKRRKRTFRALWIQRLNAAVRRSA